MKWLQIFFFITLTNSLLFATIHENAEDATTTRWKVLTAPKKTNIFNYYDEEKRSRVIQLQGDGTKSAFKLDGKNMKKGKGKANYWLSWEMKYKEDFVIMVIVGTNRGKDYILYTPSNENSYKQYGLGVDAMDGKWHSFKRNLQEDLSYYDNRVNVVSICSFVIRGSGNIDNIITNIENISKIKKVKKIKIEKINLSHAQTAKVRIPQEETGMVYKMSKVVEKRANNSLPNIEIYGDNPLHLNLGEAYVEQGVAAQDKEDGEINVVSTEDIDIYKSGEYLVMYMATDSQGNVALDKRKVYVGNDYIKATKKVKKPIKEKVEEEAPKNDELPGTEEQREELLEEEVVQQELWEEALEKRENELREIASHLR